MRAVGAEGAGVGAEGADVGAEGEGVGAEGADVGAEGEGACAEGAGVGAEGAGGSCAPEMRNGCIKKPRLLLFVRYVCRRKNMSRGCGI